jgi:hypothetical protein
LCGPEHEYWKHRIAEFLRSKGYQVEIEKPIREGKTVDIVASRNGERTAIEVETGKSDAFENIRKCGSSGFSEILVVCVNKGMRKKLTKDFDKLDAVDGPGLRIYSPKELLSK